MWLLLPCCCPAAALLPPPSQDMYACDTPWKTVDFAATYMAKLTGDGLDPNALPYAMSLVRVCSRVGAGQGGGGVSAFPLLNY
jgi:hypothetical protein